MVERVNRTIKEGIAKQMAQHQNRWTEALPTVLTILKATSSKSTGISPYELMTGRVMKLPIDPEISPADLMSLVAAKQQVVLEQLQERLKVLHAQAALKQQQADLRNDAQFNPNSETKFAEGNMIMVRVFVKQDAFAPRWHGPYEVKAVCNRCIAVTIRGKFKWYHMSQCKLFEANHTFCLEVTEDFAMGQINILGRIPLEVDGSPWWEDTFYEQGTRALTDLMDLVQKDAYTWWDWVFRGCVIASTLIFTLIQRCHFRHLIRSLHTSTHAALVLSPLQLPQGRP
ncbi:hypothetical protein SKAU_G00248360 [Synaphobranchus kaupii]|uniref:Integrase catalytic domain-containing protein n=1 Tax=Synaphobranchus kaupii TaxID=118154 RepID=A0A9Q1F2H7_SYNKA|nr:hypothetical protein SKAU_G00248360 [Synaphobranchus kaupii]